MPTLGRAEMAKNPKPTCPKCGMPMGFGHKIICPGAYG